MSDVFTIIVKKMVKTPLSLLVAGSLVVAPGLTASSVAQENIDHSKIKLWRVTYEYCISDADLKAHRYRDQSIVNTKDKRCVRPSKPLYVFAEKKPEVGFLHHIGSLLRSNERFKTDRYYAAFKGNGCVGKPISKYGWYDAGNIFSFHATYSNQTPIIPVPTSSEEIRPEDVPNLSSNSTLVIPYTPCKFLIPVQNQ